MNKNLQELLAFIIAVTNAGVTEAIIIKNAYEALKAEAGMTDDEIYEDTLARGNELDAKIVKRLAEIDASAPA